MEKNFTDEEIECRFSYHSPKNDQGERYELIRRECGKLARLIIKNSPASREQSLALTKLDEVCFWTNASIARRE